MKLNITILVLFLFYTGIRATDIPAHSDSTLSLSGLIDYALNHNLTLKSSMVKKASADLDLISSRTALFPSASASLSAGKQIDPETNVSTNASVNATVSIDPSNYISYLAEKSSVTASEYEDKQQRKDVMYSVLKQYTNAIGVFKLIEIENNNYEYQALKEKEIAEKLERGAASRSDLLQQKANCAEATMRVQEKIQQYKTLILQLVDYVGLPIEGIFCLDTLEVMNLVGKLTKDTVQHSIEVVRERDEITAQRYRVKANEALLLSSKFNYIPSLNVSGGWSANGVIAVAEQVNPSLRISGSLTIPLYDKRQRWLQMKKSVLQLQSSQIALEKSIRNARLALTEASMADMLAYDRVKTGDVRFTAAKEALTAMEERYKVGASTLTELKVVQTSFLDAASTLTQARFDRAISRLTVLFETGKLQHIIAMVSGTKKQEGVK